MDVVKKIIGKKHNSSYNFSVPKMSIPKSHFGSTTKIHPFSVERSSWNRMRQQKGLPMFGDMDKDRVPNILDCNPWDNQQQGFFHKLGNFVIGRGWTEAPAAKAPTSTKRYGATQKEIKAYTTPQYGASDLDISAYRSRKTVPSKPSVDLKKIEREAYYEELRRLQAEERSGRRAVERDYPFVYSTPQMPQFVRVVEPQFAQPGFQPVVPSFGEGIRQMSQLTGSGQGLKSMSQLPTPTKNFGSTVHMLVGQPTTSQPGYPTPKWQRVGVYAWAGDAAAEQERINAVRHFGTDARVTKLGDKFEVYVWGTDVDIDRRIDWGR
jgi:hypothetical protein